MFNGFDFSKIFDFKRIFQGAPGFQFAFYKEFLIFFGLLFFLGIALRINLVFQKNRVYRKLFKKIKNLAFTVSVLGFLYLFFRFENIYLFSSRFFLYAIILLFLIWLGFIGFYAFRKIPEELKQYKKELTIKKYLPRSKKK